MNQIRKIVDQYLPKLRIYINTKLDWFRVGDRLRWAVSTLIAIVGVGIAWGQLSQLNSQIDGLNLQIEAANDQIKLSADVANLEERNMVISLMREVDREFRANTEYQLALQEISRAGFLPPTSIENISPNILELLNFFEYLAWLRGREYEFRDNKHQAPLSYDSLRASWAGEIDNAIEVNFKGYLKKACTWKELIVSLKQNSQRLGYTTLCTDWKI